MQIGIFEKNQTLRLGVRANDEIVDITSQHEHLGHNMAALLKRIDEEPNLMANCIKSNGPRYGLGEVRLRAPILKPEKFFGVGMNYRSFMEAAERINLPLPPKQVWFSRPPSAVLGPDAGIIAPDNSRALDFEGELTIVIGRRCRHVAREDAHAVIAGYTISNDITMRDWAVRSPLLGKSFDTHGPIGPWIVDSEELGDPHALMLRTWVNGELRQSGNTSDMLSNCYELVAALSEVCTLNPGDILMTGTPDGCGVLDVPPRYLVPGDVIRIEIEGLGSLSNTIISEKAGEL